VHPSWFAHARRASVDDTPKLEQERGVPVHVPVNACAVRVVAGSVHAALLPAEELQAHTRPESARTPTT